MEKGEEYKREANGRDGEPTNTKLCLFHVTQDYKRSG
jgi:hypothetical protein